MTFAVPFDDSKLAQAALVRAGEYADALAEDVVALTVVPQGGNYAEEKGWVEDADQFDIQATVDYLQKRVETLVPDADFEFETERRRPPEGAIANELRDMAVQVDASVVFIGSDNAGRIVTPVSSVGETVAANRTYDVHVVRSVEPVTISGLDDSSDHDD